MNANEIRIKFLEFFKKRGHAVIPPAPLIPENDPTVLFTTAGMHPLVPYLLGERHPLGRRLCNFQKCLRTDDIEEVGDATHLTFFEMLGNWSLGDYFKREAIEWSFQFLTQELGLDPENLAISVFRGDKDVPRDTESFEIWLGLGIPKERIVFLGREDNWWGPAGQTGPCGPDTEMFYWTGPGPAPKIFDPNNDLWVEIWNDVFMQYNKTQEGKFEVLRQKNVDTGMGLERITFVVQGKENVFQSELFQPLFQQLRSFNYSKGLSERATERYERIISDHLKAATFLLAEDLLPSNIEQGYVLRRLIRRAVTYGYLLGVEPPFVSKIAKTVIEIYQDAYPYLPEKQNFIIKEIEREEQGFVQTLAQALKRFNNLVKGKNYLSGKQIFDLYQSFGLPFEITQELAKEKGIEIDEGGFRKELEHHKRLSRQATEERFKAGLADHSEKTIQNHSLTHLLHSALREILGPDVKQRGSNITSERLRFDFSWAKPLTSQQIKKVEDWVNDKIKREVEVKMEEMDKDQALKSGALALFPEKYPQKVKVYTMFDPQTGKVVSKEVCSGPHVEKLRREIGTFKIIKQASVGRGIRRVWAKSQ